MKNGTFICLGDVGSPGYIKDIKASEKRKEKWHRLSCNCVIGLGENYVGMMPGGDWGVSIIFKDPVSIRLRKGYSRVYRFGMMILIGVIGKGVV